MDYKLLKKAVSLKILNKKKRLKGAAKSYVSLFLVVVLVVVSTAAWFFVRDSVKVTTPALELKSSSGMQDDQLKTKQNEVIISSFRLEEASSVDGRNIFFPTSTFDNVNDVATPQVPTTTSSSSSDTLVDWVTWNGNTSGGVDSATTNMRFREGNAGDKNIRYAYADTDIFATGDDTKVWLKGYKIKIGDDVYEDKINITKDSEGKPITQNFPDPYSCPVRIAIIDDSGHKPKVFDPAARLDEYVNNTNAVLSITDAGVPTTQRTDLKAFSSYYYGTGNPLFVVPAGQKINLTVVAWLEGTHPYAKRYSGREMTMTLEIETNVADMEEIYLHDWTVGDSHGNDVNINNYKAAQDWTYDGKPSGKWLSGNVNIAMQYFDTSSDAYKTAVMTKIDMHDSSGNTVDEDGNILDTNGNTVYRAAIPKHISTDISFYRLSRGLDFADSDNDGVIDEHLDDVLPGTIYNSWHTVEDVNDFLNPPDNWKILGDLAEDRFVSGSATKYTHYFAIRGNNYNQVAHNNSQRYMMWLSPCIGYWGTVNGPVATSSN